MTTRDILVDSTHDSLLRCVQTVAEDCPTMSSHSPDLHRLRNLVIVLQSTSSTPEGPAKRQLTLGHTLALISNARHILDGLRLSGTANPVGGEMDQALSETLAGLSARVGQEMRIQQAERVRGLYVIIDPQVTGGRDPMEIANAAVRGGAKMLQLRDKLRDKGQQLPLAQALKDLCLANDVMLIIPPKFLTGLGPFLRPRETMDGVRAARDGQAPKGLDL